MHEVRVRAVLCGGDRPALRFADHHLDRRDIERVINGLAQRSGPEPRRQCGRIVADGRGSDSSAPG